MAFLLVLLVLLVRRTGFAAELADARAEALLLLRGLALRADDFLKLGVRTSDGWAFTGVRELEELVNAPLFKRTGRYNTTCSPALNAALERMPFQSATLAAPTR